MASGPVPYLDGAACGKPGADPELWLSNSPLLREAAKHVCGTCPVLADCREWAIGGGHLAAGVLGGMTPVERIRERRRRLGLLAERGLAEPSASRAGADLLKLIASQPGLSTYKLRQALPRYSPATMTQALAELESAGLIEVTITGGKGTRRHYPAQPGGLRDRSGMAALNRAKTHCGICAEPLSGPNLALITGRDGRKHRTCRNCHRRRARQSQRLRRALDRAGRPARKPARTRALTVIRRNPGLPQAALLGRMRGYSRPVVQRAVAELETAGLVTVTRGPNGALLHYPQVAA